ncbi:hypothetical protein LguiA_022701 [Lonicera macranthoides]
MGFFTRTTILFSNGEVKKRKRRAPGTPYGFLEYVSDFSVKYKNLYPRETNNIPNIVRAAGEEWKVMPPTAIAEFVEIADENKEYKQVAEYIWRVKKGVSDSSDSDPF